MGTGTTDDLVGAYVYLASDDAKWTTGTALVVDAPETVNDDPYGEGWLIRIRMSDTSEVDALMDAEAYRTHVADQ